MTMDVKKKLVELLRVNPCYNKDCIECDKRKKDCWFGELADHMIANGVTVQEWIPASEPPKEPGEYIVAKKNWLDGHLESSQGRWNGADWLVDRTECLMVSHWMPLPEPPKGE